MAANFNANVIGYILYHKASWSPEAFKEFDNIEKRINYACSQLSMKRAGFYWKEAFDEAELQATDWKQWLDDEVELYDTPDGPADAELDDIFDLEELEDETDGDEGYF